MAERGNGQSGDAGWGLKIFEPLIKEVAFGLVTPRASLNKEKWMALQKSSEFLADLKRIRREQKIPADLNSTYDMQCDWICYGEEETDVCESSWVGCLSKNKRLALDNAIKSLLYSYELPMNFYDFILGWLLYRKPSKGTPLLNFELPYQILDNPKEALRIPLSKAEKHLVTNQFRKDLGIKSGRVPKKYAATYKELQNLLAQSKNTSRTRRSLDSVTEVLKAKEEMVDYTTEKGTRIRRKKTLHEVSEASAQLDDGNLSFEAEHKAYARVRQQKSRHLKRLAKSTRKVSR